MILKQSLNYWGLPAVITRARYETTPYEDIEQKELVYPEEYSEEEAADAEPPLDAAPAQIITKVLIGESIESIASNPDVISYADKLEQVYTIVCREDLGLNDKVVITFPDGRAIRIRITEPTNTNPYTAITFGASGVVI